MIVDAVDACNLAVFDLTGSGITRNWDIKVTQYRCGDEMAGMNIKLQIHFGNKYTFACILPFQ